MYQNTCFFRLVTSGIVQIIHSLVGSNNMYVHRIMLTFRKNDVQAGAEFVRSVTVKTDKSQC
jgi:hypothetical protein